MLNSVSGSTAALQGQIQRAKLDLNDWVTCVSASTPKGKAEIQKFSGEISSAQEQITKIEATKDRSSVPSATSIPPGASGVGSPGRLIDMWV
jgi:hypothetical protein